LGAIPRTEGMRVLRIRTGRLQQHSDGCQGARTGHSAGTDFGAVQNGKSGGNFL